MQKETVVVWQEMSVKSCVIKFCYLNHKDCVCETPICFSMQSLLRCQLLLALRKNKNKRSQLFIRHPRRFSEHQLYITLLIYMLYVSGHYSVVQCNSLHVPHLILCVSCKVGLALIWSWSSLRLNPSNSWSVLGTLVLTTTLVPGINPKRTRGHLVSSKQQLKPRSDAVFFFFFFGVL